MSEDTKGTRVSEALQNSEQRRGHVAAPGYGQCVAVWLRTRRESTSCGYVSVTARPL